MKDLTYFFDRDEFFRNGKNWYDLYDRRWLVLIDAFRLQTGICRLSLHPRALGRHDGVDNGKSGYDAHNIDKHGLVQAGDTFPNINADVNEYLSMQKCFNVAKEIGFTGIGIYPQWTLHGERRCGIHLDTRRGVLPGSPSTWGYVDGEVVTVNKAFDFLIKQISEENGNR